ncbi:MAG: YitT family protein [Acetivibrionales bacterium]
MKPAGKLRDIRNDYILIIMGAVITACAINVFLVPYRLAPGGVAGIATVIYYLAGKSLPVGTIMLILNIPLFIFGLKFIGRKFIARTIFSTIFLSIAVDISEPYTRQFIQQLESENPAGSPDLLLYAIFGGFFMGIGLGLVFRSGATTGGTDLAVRIVHHFNPGLSIGKTLLAIDTAVIILAAIVFKSFLIALYSVLSLYISSKIIDIMLEGINFAKAVYIISDRADDIAKDIMKELDRGVTALKGTGMYTGKEKKVLFCVLHRGQLTQLKSIVKKIDPSAFIILGEVTEVLGEGFKTYE